MAFAQNELLPHLPLLKSFAISLCRNSATADDLVQDTMEKALVNQHSFQEGTNLRAWLMTILRNTFVSQIRKRKIEVEDAEGALAERVSVAPNQEWYLIAKDLERAMGALSLVQRTAILLIVHEEMSYEEAAEIMGCELGTMKSRVNRSRKMLQDLVDGVIRLEEVQPEGDTHDVLGFAEEDDDDIPSFISE